MGDIGSFGGLSPVLRRRRTFRKVLQHYERWIICCLSAIRDSAVVKVVLLLARVPPRHGLCHEGTEQVTMDGCFLVWCSVFRESSCSALDAVVERVPDLAEVANSKGPPFR